MHITGISNRDSHPSGKICFKVFGILGQIKAIKIVLKGIANILKKNPARFFSTKGANHRPAKKPNITVGNASIISIVGLTTRLIAGAIK